MMVEEALPTSAAPHPPASWFELSACFSLLKLTGKDSATFLDAITTQKTPSSPHFTWQAAAFLDKSAKIRLIFHLFPLANLTNATSFLLLIPTAYQQELLTILTTYHFKEDITYTVLPTRAIIAYHVNSPPSPPQSLSSNAEKSLTPYSFHNLEEFLTKLTPSSLEHVLAAYSPQTSPSAPPHPQQGCLQLANPATFILTHSPFSTNREIYIIELEQATSANVPPKSAKSVIRTFLKKHQLTLLDEAYWHKNRLASGHLLLGKEILPKDLILSLPAATTYISENKGCYPGQEIIAKMKSHSRESTYKLAGIVVTPPIMPSIEAGEPIKTHDRNLGEARAALPLERPLLETLLLPPAKLTPQTPANTPSSHHKTTAPAPPPPLKATLLIAMLHKDYTAPHTQLSFIHHNKLYHGNVINLNSLNKAAHAQKRLDVYYEKGLHAYHRNQTALARTCYQTVLAEDPNHTDSLEALAVLEEHEKNLEKAIRLNKKLTTLTPSAVMPHTNLSRLYMLKGWIEQAEAEQQRATRLTFQATARQHKQTQDAHQLEKQARYTKQHTLLKQVLELDPDDLTALFSMGKLYYEQKSYNEAIAYFTRALNNNSDHATTYLFYGKSLLHLKKTKAAKAIFLKGCVLAKKHGQLAPLRAMEYELATLNTTPTHSPPPGQK